MFEPILISLLFLTGPAGSPDLAADLEALRAVGPEGRGNARAAAAWREVARSDASALPRVLAAMDGASPLAMNWIRAAADTLAERELARGGKLPLRDLEEFLLDRRHDPRARRLAFEWIARVDKEASARLIPKMEDDPSVELRRDAVARLIEEAEGLREKKLAREAAAAYRRSLARARDGDQIHSIAARLKELGEEVDLPRHFGFLMEWKVIGPFDHTGSKAFDTAYPPESEIDPDAEYPGKEGKARWKDFSTRDASGIVDLNAALGRHKGAIAYALAEFSSHDRRPVELRLGTPNGWKVWLNGKLLFAHEEYHHGMELDQFKVEGEMRPGKNRILLKLCQNEQTEDYAQVWQFQLRITDATGTAVLSADRPAGEKR